MTATTSMPGPNDNKDSSRTIDTPEFIDRLAENLRRTSGVDLPHAYFVEQVKLQLAGSRAFDATLTEKTEGAANTSSLYQSSACFKSWAIPE